MNPQPGSELRAPAGRLAAAGGAGLAVGLCCFCWILPAAGVSCVAGEVPVDVEGGLPAAAIVIPFAEIGGDVSPALIQFYEGVLMRLHEAHRQNDLVQMRSLLDRYERNDIPEWAQTRLAGFRRLQLGLEFELHAGSRPTLRQDGEVQGQEVLGQPLRFLLEIPPLASGAITLGGQDDDDPLAVGVDLLVVDEFVDGSSERQELGEIVRLPERFELSDEALRWPLEFQLAPSGAVSRRVEFRIDLLPGFFVAERAGPTGDVTAIRAQVRRRTLCAVAARQWPPGFEVIRDRPMETLKAAMVLGGTAHFPHVRLAAEFAQRQDEPKVHEALIDWVRLGRPDQARVAMATLRKIGAAEIEIGDREGWLAWWQAQQR
jgi:hypothetical protein